MLDLLIEGELYAQEIVGRLGVAQSAVSRHLSQLERAGLVAVKLGAAQNTTPSMPTDWTRWRRRSGRKGGGAARALSGAGPVVHLIAK